MITVGYNTAIVQWRSQDFKMVKGGKPKYLKNKYLTMINILLYIKSVKNVDTVNEKRYDELPPPPQGIYFVM